ncbi:(2Fe-2S)-binding protein [Chloroflexi bacterium TSY]|nr:(2Fe-2S)-binding protein [Chloroflexi bacterium TSY]
MKIALNLKINGDWHDLYVPVQKTLLEILREELRLTGTKHGCELGECGICTVLVDGQAILSCLTLPVEIQGQTITTIEGLANEEGLHPLQSAFADLGAAQCGYCIPGMLLSAKAMIDENPTLSRQQIREQMAGNLCRCTGYTKILQAIERVVDSE